MRRTWENLRWVHIEESRVVRLGERQNVLGVWGGVGGRMRWWVRRRRRRRG